MPIKLAIVGIGNVASQNYIPYLAGREDVELGYCNRSEQKAREIAARYPGLVFRSSSEVVDWNPDAVFVLTSEMARYETAMDFVNSGVRRLFFEKPLVAALGQAHVSEEDFWRGCELVRRAEEAGCELAMIFNYRFFDQTLAAKRLITERNLGTAIHMMAQVHYACWSHCIDLVRHFAGEFQEISALPGNVTREGQGIRANDVVASFRMSNGATGTLIGTAGMQWQHPLYEMHVTFQNGRLHMRDIDGEMELLDGTANSHERIAFTRDSSRWEYYGSSFRKALTAYLSSVEANEQPPVTGRDGLKELQAEAALKRSIAERRPVTVQTEFPLP
jgi:predicted dehydrogenase